MNEGGVAYNSLNGTVIFICTNSSALASFVAKGQLVPLMVTTADPVAGFDAPTAADLGKPVLHQLVGWAGIAGPDDLADDVAAKWDKWMAAATEDETFRSTMEARGSVIELMSPEEAKVWQSECEFKFRVILLMLIRLSA